MANRRMIPTRYFKDPDIMALSSKDIQLILIGLVLAADDEGRELAHAGLLGREMDYAPEQIEAALHDLVANDLLLLYEVGRHRYYSLTRWSQWQTLGSKMSPSKYPAPPQSEPTNSAGNSQEIPAPSRRMPERGSNSPEIPAQVNQSESNRREGEGKASSVSHKVLPFPTPPADAASQTPVSSALIARILKLSESDDLRSLVQEYAQYSQLSLEGEAYSAREWIDDRQRNRKGQRMTPAFFRRWLKREREMLRSQEAKYQQQHQATGTMGPASSWGASPPSTSAGKRYPNLTGLSQHQQQQRQFLSSGSAVAQGATS